MTNAAQSEQMKKGNGFIAALDQSGGSTPKALKLYGIDESAYSGDAEMFALGHAMRSRSVTSEAFGGGRVLGAILFERTMDDAFGGKDAVAYRWEDKGVGPFLKIGKGLEDEADGVQKLKPIPGLDALLARAKAKGVFGTKERSVIKANNAKGIADVLARMARRARQPNPLAGGEADFVAAAEGFERDFRAWLPDAQRFVADWLATR